MQDTPEKTPLPFAEPGQELGLQPLDGLMEEYGFSNNDIVAASPKQLSHKVVMKARRGRRISGALQYKVLDALNLALEEREVPVRLRREDLFNYRG
jgi:hypothetical protein